MSESTVESSLAMASSCLSVKLQLKDKEAFRELYEKYSPALFGSICRTIKDQVIAQDILQNVFIKIWLNIHQYDSSKAGLYTWMLTISRNEVIDFFRSNNRKKTSFQDKPGMNGCISNLVDRLDVSILLRSLSSHDRVLVDLIYLKGFSFQQASSLLSVPLGTIKTRMRRILKGLREKQPQNLAI